MKILKSKANINLILSASSICFYQMIIGGTFVFSSSLFVQLESPTSNIKLTVEEASWIASVPLIICPFCVIITGILMDKFGRRFTLQLACIPMILSWTLLGFANSYKTILIGRIIAGLIFGSGTCVVVYLAEVGSVKLRPLFSAMVSVFVSVGGIWVFALCEFFHWNTVSLLMAAASAAGCAFLSLIPEPPVWLRDRGRTAQAEAAERWFGVTTALEARAPVGGPTISTVTAPTVTADTAAAARGWWHSYARPTVWKPTLISIAFFACQQCSGTYVLMFYSADVLRECSVQWNTTAVSMFLFATRVPGCLAFAALHRVRRRTLGAVSCAGMAAAFAVVVATMRFPMDEATRLAHGPVVVVAFTVSVVSAQIGLTPMPWFLCGEVFPTDVKGTMSGVVQTFGFILMFTIIKIYPLMVSILGIENVWTIFALFSIVLSAGLMSFHQIIIGCSYVFSSTLFAQLRQPTSKIKLTGEEASWIASIPIIICPFGLIITGILMDKFGRRFTLQLAYIPLILSWIVLGYAESYKAILIGRIILGTIFGSGTCVFVYLAEVSSAKRRPLFTAMLSVFVGIGNIAVSALSVFFHWHTVSLLLAAASVAGCASLFIVPEPPMWLRGHGRAAEAEAAERWFGLTSPADAAQAVDGAPAADGTADVPAENGTGVELAANGTGAVVPAADGAVDARRGWWASFTRPTVWKPTLISIAFFTCQQCSGIYVLLFYAVDVLRDCGVPWDPSMVTVFMFAIRVLSCLTFTALHWVRRKTLGVVSCAGMAAAFAVVVATMRFPMDEATRLAHGLVVVVAFAVSVFSAQIGMTPMPWFLCGEVFPTDVKGTMSGVVQTFGFILMFTIIKIYPLMVPILGIENIWTIFALFSIVLSAGLMTFHQIIIGCTYVFSSTLFAQLRQPTSKIKLTGEEASWIASIPIIICPFGLIITGILMDKFGRRFTLQLAYIPLILSWIVLGYAESYKAILIGRIILGTTFGAGTCVFVYLAEVSSAKRRPLFTAVLSVFVSIGNIAVSALSVFFHWHTVSLLLAAASVAGCASLFIVPEPPVWLRGHGRVAEAEAAERWFGLTSTADAAQAVDGAPAVDGTADVPAENGTGVELAANGTGVELAANGTGAVVPAADGAVDARRGWWASFTRPTVWKPTLISIAFFACQQCSGIYVLLFYAVDVLRDCGVPWDPSVVTVFLFATRVLSCLTFAALHWVRRKTLGVVSCAGMAAALAVVVAAMRLPLDEDTHHALGPAIIVAFTVYVFSTQIGMLPMPWSLCGEVFPMDVKGKMTGVVQTCGFTLMFSIIKIYPLMVSILGVENVWTIFTLFSILSSLFCIFILPETQGVPLDVILTYFEPRKKPTQSTTVTSPQLEIRSSV